MVRGVEQEEVGGHAGGGGGSVVGLLELGRGVGRGRGGICVREVPAKDGAVECLCAGEVQRGDFGPGYGVYLKWC